MRTKTIALFILPVCAIIFLSMAKNSFNRASYPIYDLLQRTSPLIHNNEIILIKVDQPSIENMYNDDGMAFPWPRQYYGALVAAAKEIGAKAIFFDIIFSENSSYGIEDDQIFSDLIKSSNIPVYFNQASHSHTVKKPIPVLESVAKKLGGIHLLPSVDGVYRIMPRVIEKNRKSTIESIPFVIADDLNLNKSENESISFYSNEFYSESFYNLIIAYKDILNSKFDKNKYKQLQNKIWIVGYSAPGLYDLRPTPVSKQSTGMFIHASSLANRLQGDGIANSSFLVDLTFGIISIIIVFLIGVYIAPRPIDAVLHFIVWSNIPPIIFCYIMWKGSIWYNPLPYIVFSLIAGMSVIYIRFKIEWKERLRIEHGLSTSMSKGMMELVKKGSVSDLRFDESKNITILFSDIVGFTTISESLPPHDLVVLLDKYYDEIVKLIFKHNGYVDKFIGDAVMALWGAPVHIEDHAKHGLQTAILYHKAVKRINDILQEQNKNLPLLDARVGIHTGHVTAGNIGSSERFNYTVIGDAVNLAARLESIGKTYKCNLLISEDTIIQSGMVATPQIFEIDEIIVKGKTESTKIYTYEENPINKNFYQRGLTEYRNSNFTGAVQLFNNCQQFGPALVMEKRCENIILKGIPSSFNKGVWCHDNK